MNILAISGSLRSASINSALLRAVRHLAPGEIIVDVFVDMGDLPLFNPDLEATMPAIVRRFQQRVAIADAILIASPEYAHGVTGCMKNALDWLVSYEPFAHKAVAVLNASPRARHADAALREILKTMSANIVESASITIPLLGSGLDELGMVHNLSVTTAIRTMLVNLKDAVVCQRDAQSAAFPL